MRTDISKRLGVWAVIVAAVLMIPVIGNWPWTASDFALGFSLLFGSAIVYELLTRNTYDQNRRIAIGAAVFAVLAAIWVMLATG